MAEFSTKSIIIMLLVTVLSACSTIDESRPTTSTLAPGEYETSYEPKNKMQAFKGVLKVLPDGTATWYRHPNYLKDFCAERAVRAEITPKGDAVAIKFMLDDLGSPKCVTFTRVLHSDNHGGLQTHYDNGASYFIRPVK